MPALACRFRLVWTGGAREEAFRCILLGGCLWYLCAPYACQALTSPKGMRHLGGPVGDHKLAVKILDFLGSVAILAGGAKGPAAVGLVAPLVLGKQALQMGAGMFNLPRAGRYRRAWRVHMLMPRHGTVRRVHAVVHGAAGDSAAVR